MNRRVIILGTGGTSVDILDTIIDLNNAGAEPIECAGFLDDNADAWDRSIFGVPVLGPLAMADHFDDCLFVNGIGSPESYSRRPEIIRRTGVPVERFLTLIHPTASVSQSARLGRGVVIFQHVTVTANAWIGDHVVALPNSVVSHDVRIGDYTCVAGGVKISGGVTIGRGCYIGTGSAIIGGVEIGDGALVGLGSAVIRNVPANTVVVGNPARPLRTARPVGVAASH